MRRLTEQRFYSCAEFADCTCNLFNKVLKKYPGLSREDLWRIATKYPFTFLQKNLPWILESVVKQRQTFVSTSQPDNINMCRISQIFYIKWKLDLLSLKQQTFCCLQMLNNQHNMQLCKAFLISQPTTSGYKGHPGFKTTFNSLCVNKWNKIIKTQRDPTMLGKSPCLLLMPLARADRWSIRVQ